NDEGGSCLGNCGGQAATKQACGAGEEDGVIFEGEGVGHGSGAGGEKVRSEKGDEVRNLMSGSSGGTSASCWSRKEMVEQRLQFSFLESEGGRGELEKFYCCQSSFRRCAK